MNIHVQTCTYVVAAEGMRWSVDYNLSELLKFHCLGVCSEEVLRLSQKTTAYDKEDINN